MITLGVRRVIAWCMRNYIPHDAAGAMEHDSSENEYTDFRAKFHPLKTPFSFSL